VFHQIIWYSTSFHVQCWSNWNPIPYQCLCIIFGAIAYLEEESVSEILLSKEFFVWLSDCTDKPWGRFWWEDRSLLTGLCYIGFGGTWRHTYSDDFGGFYWIRIRGNTRHWLVLSTIMANQTNRRFKAIYLILKWHKFDRKTSQWMMMESYDVS
jgi:hypothetical protein